MNNACLGVRIIGPLAPHADGFRSWLSGQWYTTLTAADQLRLMAHVSWWMASQKLDCAALTDEVTAEFIRAPESGVSESALAKNADAAADLPALDRRGA